MSKKQEQQSEIDRLRNDLAAQRQKVMEHVTEEQRIRRALYAGTRRYMRQSALGVAAAGLTKVQRQVIERLREELRTMTEHRDELQEFADSLRGEISAAVLTGDRYRRALDAGARRYQREQQRANERVALVEESAVQTALTALEAVQDAHQSRKLTAAATRRADKLAAKLMIRARETGKERLAYGHAIVGRERALEAATKRARGLQASLRKVKGELKTERQELARAWEQVRELRRKLRESNKSVLVASLGGGLEVQPVSGRPFESTAGYSPAARRAAEGQQ